MPCQVDLYASEAALLGALGAAVAAADPDILLGFEVQRSSLGYAAERAATLGLPSLLRVLSRLPRVSWAVGWGVGHCFALVPAWCLPASLSASQPSSKHIDSLFVVSPSYNCNNCPLLLFCRLRDRRRM